MSTNSAEIYAGVGAVFREVFPQASGEVHPEMTATDVPGWDSLGHVSLIASLEDKFDIEFTPDEYVEFDSVGELVALIEAKLR